MAARKHLSHDAKTRERIRTSQLINRLHDNAFGKVELSATQIKSIEILLRKSLPDLSSIHIEGTIETQPPAFTVHDWVMPEQQIGHA
jgi:hypothetical protein